MKRPILSDLILTFVITVAVIAYGSAMTGAVMLAYVAFGLVGGGLVFFLVTFGSAFAWARVTAS